MTGVRWLTGGLCGVAEAAPRDALAGWHPAPARSHRPTHRGIGGTSAWRASAWTRRRIEPEASPGRGPEPHRAPAGPRGSGVWPVSTRNGQRFWSARRRAQVLRRP